jgi:hypothetical protein
MKNLRFSMSVRLRAATIALQWLYNLEVSPEMTGIRNMQRLLALTSKVKTIGAEDVVSRFGAAG